MLASDSEESDYEDARQHHDNEVDPDNDPHRSHQQQQHQEVEIRQENVPVLAEVNVNVIPNANVNVEEEIELPGINARMIVEHVIDNLWPLGGGYDDEIENGLDNVHNGYFDEENGNGMVDSDEDDTVSFHSETDEPDVYHGRNRQNQSDDNNPLVQNQEIEVPAPEFDPQLPARHEYLGEGMEELQGRVVFLDEGSTPEIPLIVMGIQLVPGQTLPLTIFHNVFQNAIRRCVVNDRVFGIVHSEMDAIAGSMIFKGAFGTLAEIYEFQEESDPNPNGNPAEMNTFALKAKGRQRFNVVDFRRQADGNLMGRVQIRPEISLPPLVERIQFGQTHRYRFQVKRKIGEDGSQPQTSENKVARKLSNCSVSVNEEELTLIDTDIDLINMRKKIKEQRKATKYYSAFTPFPYFVYEQFEELTLVERVHRKLKVELKGLTESGSIIPKDATELSFWLAQNLTMDDHHRIKILKMDSPIQRLRYELDLLSRASKVITCRFCQTKIAESSEIFAMSIEGPQGTYVNPQGFLHETLTVHKAKDIKLRGFPSTQASWFPGYSWTIAECRRCSSHLGWKFRAVGRLTPPKFWGLARKSVSFKYDLVRESDQEENPTNASPPTTAPTASDFSLAI